MNKDDIKELEEIFEKHGAIDSFDKHDLLVESILAYLSSKKEEWIKEVVEEVKNLFDEYNDMDDNSMQFELRIRQPKLTEFLNKINEIK